MSIRSNELLEIQIKVEGVKYSYIGLGQYEDSEDGVFRYWPNSDSKLDFYNFLINADLCILLFTIGQQANLGEVNYIENSNFEFILKLANKYFEEYDSGISLKNPLFIDWSLEDYAGGSVQVKLQENNNFENIFIRKTTYEELSKDLNQYVGLFA